MNFYRRFCRAVFAASILQMILAGISWAASLPLHHELTVHLDPYRTSAKIEDRLTVHLDEDQDFVLQLYLHANFWLGEIKIPDNKDFIIETTRSSISGEDIPVTNISIRKITDNPWPENIEINFKYEGTLFDPQNPGNADKAGQGVFLSGASFFYPQTLTQNDTPDLMTFQLTAHQPDGWKVVSQGRKMSQDPTGKRVAWQATQPMEEIFLIANRYEEYERAHGDITFYAFLLGKDQGLADTYFEAARKYLDFYEKLIGPYPYSKFALIENALETGFGMASFTFLGSKVIRFPFILNTSYPHEILHNWWGNSVYIDPHSGNWAEGLTAYLSDHFLLDLEGKGDQYRLQQLIKFLNYVNKANDFPLIEFKSRSDMASQAIGYGKMLMMLHMLRLQVGNEFFLEALRGFYRDFRFRFAGLGDLRRSFETASDMDLSAFFDHWTYRLGAPELELASATHTEEGGRHRLAIEVKQTQSGPAFPLSLPVAIWTRDTRLPEMALLNMTGKTLTHTFELSGEPGQLQIDPYTEVFRMLNRRDVPPSIGQTFGSQLPSRILPSREEFPDVLLGYHQFAQSLAENATTAGILVDDADLTAVPKGGLWVFGRKNAYAKKLEPQLKSYGVKLLEDHVRIGKETYTWEDHSFVFTVQRPGGVEGSVTWVVVGSGESIPGLIRKLPHYGKYGALVFKGNEPHNTLKSLWPFKPQSLMKRFHAGDYSLPIQPALIDYKPE